MDICIEYDKEFKYIWLGGSIKDLKKNMICLRKKKNKCGLSCFACYS